MKKTQVKDSYRNIIKQIVSYLSIVIIAMLAVTIFLGIYFSSSAIGKNGNDFYDEANYRDVEVISTYALTEEDLTTLRNIEGVHDVEGIYQVQGVITDDLHSNDVDIVSLSERINRPIVVEGRLPEDETECCIESYISNRAGIKVGDKVKLVTESGKKIKYLKGAEFVVTGIVYHADQPCSETVIPGNRYIIVMPDAFDKEALDNCYNKALITFASTRGMYRFDKEYLEACENPLAAVNSIADERAQLRYQEVYGRLDDKLNEGQSQLDDARTQLDDARGELDRGREQLESGQQELTNASDQLIDAESQLVDAEGSLESGRARVEEGEQKLDEAAIQLREGRKKLEDAEAQMADAEQQLRQGEQAIADAHQQMEDGIKTLEEKIAEITDIKDIVRNKLRDALRSAIGDYADQLDWSSSGSLPSMDDPNADATKFAITNKIEIDFNKSMGDNIYALIASLGIPEETLREAFEAATGIYEELSDGSSWLDRVVEYATEQYKNYDNRYNEFAGMARKWNEYHELYLEAKQMLADGEAEFNRRLAQYNDARKQLDDGWDTYYSKLALYNSGRRQINDARRQLQDGEESIASAQSAISEGRESYESGVNALESGRAELESGESKYAEGLEQYEEGVEKLNTSREELEKMDQCRWVVLSAYESPAFDTIARSSKNLKDIAMTFSVVFLLVASLVIFSTLGRIIDEQRNLVGATKALGLYNGEIFAKYLAFGLSGTVIGMLAGCVMAYVLIERIVLKGYGSTFVYGGGPFAFSWPLTIIVLLSGAAMATLTVLFACFGLLKSSAVQLMMDKVPFVPKKASRESKGAPKHLYSKLLVRNMLSDKKRVVATIISITGCCALLVGGFTIQYAIQNAVKGQFDDYEHYDLKVFYDASSETAAQEISGLLAEKGTSSARVRDKVLPMRIEGKLLSSELVCCDLSKINDYFCLKDAYTDGDIAYGAEGVWIHQKISESYNLQPGDDIILYNGTMKPFRARVAGVYKNYIGMNIFVSEENYKQIFDEDPAMNSYYVNLNGYDVETLENDLKSIEGYRSITDIARRRENCDMIASVLYSVSVICIIMSAMMAYFILLNLVSMFVHQKRRELTIMRVNGFTLKQVIGYVAKEFIASTIIGTVLGLAGGAILGFRVILLLESDQIMFDRTIQWYGWVFSVLITFAFATAICIPVFRKIKFLKLADITT